MIEDWRVSFSLVLFLVFSCYFLGGCREVWDFFIGFLVIFLVFLVFLHFLTPICWKLKDIFQPCYFFWRLFIGFSYVFVYPFLFCWCSFTFWKALKTALCVEDWKTSFSLAIFLVAVAKFETFYWFCSSWFYLTSVNPRKIPPVKEQRGKMKM